MTLTTFLLNVAAMLCSLLIIWRTEPALNRMGDNTHWMIRYAMLLLAGGALGTIIGIVTGSLIDLKTLAVLAGIALLLFCDRRLRALTRRTRNGGRHA